jgi:uncharacterized protein
MKKMNPVVHFEMPYSDDKRLSTFYSDVFGWQMEKLGVGKFVAFSDTEGNRISMLQPKNM